MATLRSLGISGHPEGPFLPKLLPCLGRKQMSRSPCGKASPSRREGGGSLGRWEGLDVSGWVEKHTK